MMLLRCLSQTTPACAHPRKPRIFHRPNASSKYRRQRMQAILPDGIRVAEIVKVEVIPLDHASRGYDSFEHAAADKFVIGEPPSPASPARSWRFH